MYLTADSGMAFIAVIPSMPLSAELVTNILLVSSAINVFTTQHIQHSHGFPCLLVCPSTQDTVHVQLILSTYRHGHHSQASDSLEIERWSE